MQTKYWRVDPHADASHPSLLEAANMLRQGKVVAFPTETVYGLGADARSTAAVERIYQAKGRPLDNPLIVHIADLEQLADLVVHQNKQATDLMERFWPGPLTLVLPVKPHAVSPRVTAGLTTIAVRMPAHPLALSLIAAAGCPIAAPSANRSGKPSPTLASHVKEDLNGLIDGLLDGGRAGIGLESTVVEFIGNRVHILRPGGVTQAQLQQIVPDVLLDESLLGTAGSRDHSSDHSDRRSTPRSPGMKYKHYAPQGTMQVVRGTTPQEVTQWIQEHIDAANESGERTGILSFREHARSYRADLVLSCGSMNDLESAGRELYAALRKFDESGITYILAEACSDEGIGFAIMNRLNKAADQRIVRL